jgi:hypothetical protein
MRNAACRSHINDVPRSQFDIAVNHRWNLNLRVADKRGLRLAWRRGLGKVRLIELSSLAALLAAARMVGAGELEQFDGRAVFDYERDADSVGWAVGRNQDFAASKLGGEISHFKRDVRNLPDEIRDRRVRFETHPLHAKFAFLVADDKEFQVFQVGLARLRFSSGNSDVMVPAHCFSLSVELAQILRCRYRV